MRTRTLLLLAVTCGLVILLAGGIFFWQLSNQKSTLPLVVGDTGTAGDVRVTVGGIDEADGRMTVTISIGGAEDGDALDGFTLVGVPNPVDALPDAGTCGSITVTAVTCTVVFPTDEFTTADRQLLFNRADDQIRWKLV